LKYKDVVINESKKLKNNGANAVLILSHVGNACPASSDYGIWSEEVTQE
jgi:hypothetical protein